MRQRQAVADAATLPRRRKDVAAGAGAVGRGFSHNRRADRALGIESVFTRRRR